MIINGIMLADYVTIPPDGVVFIARGGVRSLPKTQFPAQMNVQLVVSIDLSEPPEGETFDLALTVESDNGQLVAQFEGVIPAIIESENDCWGAISIVPVSLSAVELPAPGNYLAKARLQNGSEQVVRFVARIAESPVG